jgi:predicted dehydrogenase
MSHLQPNRRDFLGLAMAGLTAPYVFTARTARAQSKNDRLQAAVIGMGGRGTNMAILQFHPHAVLVAVCDADLRRGEKARAAIRKRTGREVKVYQDYRELLARPDIDVVGNATPDHWHTKINVAACRAGKDLYAEKPLTLTIDEGKILRRVVAETGRVVQVGAQQRSNYAFRTACELVRNGRIGKLKQVAVLLPFGVVDGTPCREEPVPKELDWDLWQGQAPLHPFTTARLNFRPWFEYSGGMMTDWGHHHFDIAHWGMGMEGSGPLSVEARGYLPNLRRTDTPTTADAFAARLEYPGGIELWCMSVRDERYQKSLALGHPPADVDRKLFAEVPEFIKQETRNGVMFIGERGRIFVNRGGMSGRAVDELATSPLGPDAIRLYKSDNHEANFFECVGTRKKPISEAATQHRSITPCHLLNLSMRLGRKLAWDPVREQIVGDQEACGWLKRPQRAPYQIEGS